jgi:hypothetical protein
MNDSLFERRIFFKIYESSLKNFYEGYEFWDQTLGKIDKKIASMGQSMENFFF